MNLHLKALASAFPWSAWPQRSSRNAFARRPVFQLLYLDRLSSRKFNSLRTPKVYTKPTAFLADLQHLATTGVTSTRSLIPSIRLSTSPLTAPAKDAAAKKATSIRGLMREYGPVAVITYFLVSVASITLWYIAVSSGVDINPLVARIANFRIAVHEKVADGMDAMQENIHQLGEEIKHVGGEVAVRMEKAMEEGLEAVGEGLRRGERAVEEVRNSVAEAMELAHRQPADTATQPSESSSLYAKHGTTLLVVWAAHNLILPVRVGVTAVMTPWVAARIRALGLETWLKRVASRFSS
ncbi:hypothetical protein DFJ73DRAFT_821974 [Zopfochytrium polystomum]|nr:hypothetical protein DFJ73DRAFT_821974 [Zopfochytrium polystomum]